jgi:hypothetical protein
MVLPLIMLTVGIEKNTLDKQLVDAGQQFAKGAGSRQ